MALVLVDVDGTLIQGANAERLFLRYLFFQRYLGFRQLGAFIAFLPHYAFPFGRHVFKKNKAYLSGLPVNVVKSWGIAFVDQQLLPRASKPLLGRLQQHVQWGDHLALLTGTPDFIARPLAERLAIPHVIATVCDQQNGRFTACPPRLHPFGAMKVAAALELCRPWGLSLQDCIAYADSIHDLPLLERVGQAIAVAPDSALGARANRDGWEIMAA